jgi:hypothetical protein
VVDIDLERFFDRVNHDMLMGRVAKRVKDKRVLKLIRAFLNAGVVMEDGVVIPTGEGTPQGGPLSPLLSNLMLDDLDRELERRGIFLSERTVRYHLRIADERGYTLPAGRDGRVITRAGLEEVREHSLHSSLVSYARSLRCQPSRPRSTLKKELASVLKSFDHKLLNDVAPFLIKNPTSENLAETIYRQLKKKSKNLSKVTVWESTTTYASYY